LIEKGANINHKDKTGKTPFHHAAISGQVGVLEDLIEQLDKPSMVHQMEDIDR
jgi:ankyrin repeat protein